MTHQNSPEDLRFVSELEACALEPDQFDHRAHVRAAYVYLVDNDVERAAERMRDSLRAFLLHHGIDVSKYHETITRAWILAVRHFMELTPASVSADDFIRSNPRLLDSRIMLTHYSAEHLFSPKARAQFVEPDIQSIPRHE